MSEEFRVPRFFWGQIPPWVLSRISAISMILNRVGSHIFSRGGPGTGKSTLMKRAAKACSRRGRPHRADLLLFRRRFSRRRHFPDLKRCIADGTAPHVLEPQFPGVSDVIVNLGSAGTARRSSKSGRKSSPSPKNARRCISVPGVISRPAARSTATSPR